MTIELNDWTINNVDEDYTLYPYLVARLSEGEWWFYGCFKSKEGATVCALNIGGRVFSTRE